MSVSRLSPLCLVLILASSALGTFPFAYPDFRAAPLSFGPHLFYGSGISGGNVDLTGFSYFTKDFGGGGSEVVFFTGPNSDINMNEEVVAMKDQMNSWPAITDEQKSDKDDNKVMKSDLTNDEDASKIAPLAPVETKESTSSENQVETTSTTARPTEEKKEDADTIIGGLFNGQVLREKIPGFEAPYPVLRLGGTTSFYPQLPTPFSGFGGYGPSDYFRSQYVPFVNDYSSYQSLYNPLYSSIDTNYYNPEVFPTVYESPIIPSSSSSSVDSFISEKVQDGSVKDAPTVVKVDKRVGEKADDHSEDKTKTGGDSPSTEKVIIEVPTTTERMAEKPTTVSETAPTTTEETKEMMTTTTTGTTTVVDDAVAVE